MKKPIRRAALVLLTLLPSLVILPGCAGSGGRVTAFPVESAPAATMAQTTVRIDEIERAPGELILALSIANPTTEPVIFTRNYRVFTAATVALGDVHITGERSPKKSRTVPSNQYTVLAGEEAALRLVFRAPDIDRAAAVTLHVVGSTHGAAQSWVIPIPPEPSRSTAMASAH